MPTVCGQSVFSGEWRYLTVGVAADFIHQPPGKMNASTITQKTLYIIYVIFITSMLTIATNGVSAQEKSTYMRIAKITVDSTQLAPYIAALREQMDAALKLEKGVLAYAAVQDKLEPWKITIMETYASVAAYEQHILTEHFKKYKATVENMVKELELTDVVPIAVKSKLN